MSFDSDFSRQIIFSDEYVLQVLGFCELRTLLFWAYKTNERFNQINRETKKWLSGMLGRPIMWQVYIILIKNSQRSHLVSNDGRPWLVKGSTTPAECFFQQAGAFAHTTWAIWSPLNECFRIRHWKIWWNRLAGKITQLNTTDFFSRNFRRINCVGLQCLTYRSLSEK